MKNISEYFVFVALLLQGEIVHVPSKQGKKMGGEGSAELRRS